MKVGIWIRVSTDMQVEAESPLTHERRARGYAEARDWEVAEVYRLEAVSGKSVMDHPEAKRMMADTRSGKVKALIFSKLARLARNTRELLAFSDHFQECGANLVSLGESIDTTTPAGRLYFTLIAALTQWEREEIASRVQAAVPVRAKMGKSLGGAAPYGFRWENNQLLKDEVEAPVRALMYELFLQERKIRTVARLLNERGYRTRNGSAWTGTSILRLLKDPTAKGLRVANYTKMNGRKKSWELKDPKEWVHLGCEVLVSEDKWTEVNNLLSGRKKVLKPGRPVVHLFAGLCRCQCGQKMYVRSRSPTKYVCSSCTNKIPIADLEALFHDELASFFVDEKEVDKRMQEADTALSQKQALLESRIEEEKKLKREADKAYVLYQADQIDVRGFGERYNPLKERLSLLSEEIPRLQGELDAANILRLSKTEVMLEAKTLHSQWELMERLEKRAIVEAITSEIEVGHGEVTFSLLANSSLIGNDNATREHSRVAYLLPGVLHVRSVSKFRGLKIGTLSHRLLEYRQKRQLGQSDLARILDVDEFTILNWEKSKTEPESRHVPKLTELLGNQYRPHSHLIWQRVKSFRESLGLNQKEFATHLQVNPSTILRWEQGKGILPKRLLKMMGEEVVFYKPNTRMSEGEVRRWREWWEQNS